MRGRAALWAGSAVTVAAAAAMGAYFAIAGLDKATAAATILAAFFALAGLAVAVYGVATAGGPRPGKPDDASRAAPGPGGATNSNIITGSTVNGTVIQIGSLEDGSRDEPR